MAQQHQTDPDHPMHVYRFRINAGDGFTVNGYATLKGMVDARLVFFADQKPAEYDNPVFEVTSSDATGVRYWCRIHAPHQVLPIVLIHNFMRTLRGMPLDDRPTVTWTAADGWVVR